MGCYMPYLRTRTSKGSRAWNVLVRVAEEVLCCRRCCRCEAAGCRDAAAERRHCGTGSSKVHGKDYRLSGTRGHLVNCLTVSSLNIMDQKTRLFYSYVRHVYLASGYANQHAMSQTPNLEIERVAAGRAPGGKYLGAWMSALILYRRRRFINHLLTYSRSRPCGCCRPASGHTVRGVSERGPSTAINRRPHQIQNYW